MSLRYAILGLLSHSPKTGYDLKGIMQSLPFMYWSASNNQIYNTLTELKNEAYVTNETLIQESLPSKKLYTVTPSGLEALKQWTMSTPEPPEFRKDFLIQLAWSEQLRNKQLNELLDSYADEVKARMALENKLVKDGPYSPARSEREKLIWDSIFDNCIRGYENELIWIAELKKKLKEIDCSAYEFEENDQKGEIKMFNYSIMQGYIEVMPNGRIICSEQDTSDLIAICVENAMNKLLINDGAISDDFLRLQTGVAGTLLQKFTNYNIKAAFVVDKDRMNTRFSELALELNHGKLFNVSHDAQAAEEWIKAIE